MQFTKLLCCKASLSWDRLGLLNTHAEEQKWPKCSIVCTYEETRDRHGVLVGGQTICKITHSVSNGVLVCDWKLNAAVDVHVEGEFSSASILKHLQSRAVSVS